MRSKNLLFLLVGLLVLGSCTATKVVVNKTNVEKLLPGASPSLSGVDYALPRTAIDLIVTAEKRMTQPGPFAEYAERYLGVTQVITKESTEWVIKEVQLKSHPERDPEQVYRVETEGVSNAGLVQLDPQGIILGVNLPYPSFKDFTRESPKSSVRPVADLPDYPDLTIRKNTEPMMDTIFRVVRTDSSFARLPMLKSQVSKKTLMNQAEEAANLIMKLRKRRFYLLTGEYAYRTDVKTPMPEGAALDVIIRELAQLEYDYVSLFVGRTSTETHTQTFTYIPSGTGQSETNDLFVFSRFRGILPAGNSNGDPVKINISKIIDPSEMYSNTAISAEGESVSPNRGLAYRIPGTAEVRINLNSENLLNQKLLIAQYGVIQYLPAQLFLQEGTGIEFYRETGLVKQVFKRTGLE